MSHRLRPTLLLLILLQIGTGTAQNFYDSEKSLRTTVLNNYEYKIRPESIVNCNVRLSLLAINILDVPQQSFSVSGWLTVKWNDSRLTWTPATYGNIADFYDTELVLWRPELIVDNSVANLGVIESDKLLIRVTSEGNMVWEPPGIFETHCDVDVTFYPFDTQTCEIEVTSWSYTKEEVDLYATDSDIYLEDFLESGEWEILDTWSERRILVDGDDEHSQVDFILKLRRRPNYYVMTILIPVIVTSVLCVLVFLLPADSGEKVGYTLTILLTYTVMLTLVAGYMPPTSKTTSVLSIYLTIILFVGVISTLVTVVVLYFHHHSNVRPIHPALESFFRNGLIPLIRWKREEGDSNEGDDIQDVFLNRKMSNKNKVHPSINDEGQNSTKTRPTTAKSTNQKGGNKSGDDVGELTWQDMAVILDAVFFRLMGTVVTVLTVSVIVALLVGGYTAS